MVLDYNMKTNNAKNKGSAIFIHIIKKNYQIKQLGCIALKKKDHLIELLKKIKKVKGNNLLIIANRFIKYRRSYTDKCCAIF